MLKPLLARARAYHPEYGGGLCNHLPMALIALDRMGASPARLQRYATEYLRNMEPAPTPGTAIGEGNWTERLGEQAAYADYLGFFRREVQRLTARPAIRAYLPRLARGVAAAAFHPLIRTAFGVIGDDQEEVAVGLAYWAARHLKLPRQGPAIGEAVEEMAPSDDPVALLAALRGSDDLAFESNPDNLIDREFAEASSHPRFGTIARALAIDDLSFDKLRRAAALLYLGTEDFTALHGVTGLHAARILAGFADDPRAFAAQLWRALLALYLALDRPALPDAAAVAKLTQGPLPDWNRILPAAVESEDEHTIKLVFTCLDETRAGYGRLYRYLAARKVGLLARADAAETASAG
ncbi:MAG TPA: questin oxidase family protein [Dongiaceae bacterium]|nr:questin oxidase family protein [Dongiaceae bacterium]